MSIHPMNNTEKEKDTIKQILYNNKYYITLLNNYIIQEREREREEKITNNMGKIYICW
jgi:hypothetical protein